MNKQLLLVLTAVGLGVIYVFYFTDWTQKKVIQISYRNMANRGRGNTTIFYLDKKYRLSSLKVVSAADAATNKYPHALWHLVVEKETKPMLQFAYAQRIAGMKPNMPDMRPEPLQPGTKYQIMIKDDRGVTGQTVFETQ